MEEFKRVLSKVTLAALLMILMLVAKVESSKIVVESKSRDIDAVKANDSEIVTDNSGMITNRRIWNEWTIGKQSSKKDKEIWRDNYKDNNMREFMKGVSNMTVANLHNVGREITLGDFNVDCGGCNPSNKENCRGAPWTVTLTQNSLNYGLPGTNDNCPSKEYCQHNLDLRKEDEVSKLCSRIDLVNVADMLANAIRTKCGVPVACSAKCQGYWRLFPQPSPYEPIEKFDPNACGTNIAINFKFTICQTCIPNPLWPFSNCLGCCDCYANNQNAIPCVYSASCVP
jgi:hypothetical protein